MLKTSHDYFYPLLEAAKRSPALAAWLAQKPGEYMDWPAQRVQSAAHEAVARLNTPIARAALAELPGKEKAKHLDFAKVHSAFMALDAVQGGFRRIFELSEWDRAVDTYYAVLNRVADEGPDAVEKALASLRVPLLPGAPSVPSGSRFSSWGDLYRAVEDVQESKYRMPFPGLDKGGNVTILPFHTTRHEERRSSYDAVCALTFAVEKGKTKDSLLVLFHPLVNIKLARVRDNERGVDGEPRRITGALASVNARGQWRVETESRGSYGSHAYAPWGPVFFSDAPVQYVLPVNEEGLTSIPSALRRRVQQALTDAGYKHQDLYAKSTKWVGWHEKGPRAFLTGGENFAGLRHPGAS